ncbi:hypothetical protein [Haploplasma axanthum]|uniref:hypothetical protein n=1 Tax=Haploplasma axanthum TaxID=29552 RepID=UPI000406CBF1|nr:hypothetical protein [Haploplasma axanthum]
MNFIERLKAQKGTGLSGNLLFMFMFVVSAADIAVTLSYGIEFSLIWQALLIKIVGYVIWILIATKFENIGSSFVAHFICFAFFVPESLRMVYELITMQTSYGLIDGIIILFSGFVAAYSLIKMYAHRDEIKLYQVSVKREIKLLLTITLIYSYFNFSFLTTILYIVIILLILATSKAKESLLFVIAVYVLDVFSDLINVRVISTLGIMELIMYAIGILISIFIIYFAYRVYRESDFDNLDSEYYA